MGTNYQDQYRQVLSEVHQIQYPRLSINLYVFNCWTCLRTTWSEIYRNVASVVGQLSEFNKTLGLVKNIDLLSNILIGEILTKVI